MIGGDTVFRDGSLVNKVGTTDLAKAAKKAGLPVIVACEVIKLAPEDPRKPGEERFDLTAPEPPSDLPELVRSWYPTVADDEVAAERIDRRWARVRHAAEEARDGGPSVEGALDLALELEGGEARADFARATTPRDPTLRASLEGSSPPPPAKQAMLERVSAALESLGAGPGSDRLRRLARELAREDGPGG